MTKSPQPNSAQLAALQAYADKKGRYWKNELSLVWIRGSEDREQNGSLLRQVRNDFGGDWLYSKQCKSTSVKETA